MKYSSKPTEEYLKYARQELALLIVQFEEFLTRLKKGEAKDAAKRNPKVTNTAVFKGLTTIQEMAAQCENKIFKTRTLLYFMLTQFTNSPNLPLESARCFSSRKKDCEKSGNKLVNTLPIDPDEWEEQNPKIDKGSYDPSSPKVDS